MASGDTKTEALLDILGNGGDASAYRGCCNTKTQSYILDAIDRVQNVEDEVEELKNNPDVVDIVATYADLQAYDTQHLTDKDIIRVLQDETHNGDSTYYRYNKQSDTWTYIGESKQYEDFVGTDGTTAGEAGLVPAPAVTDAGKFLKADGTWDTAGGSGDSVITLTSSDYNYHSSGDTDDGIAIWLLEPGAYKWGAQLKTYTSSAPTSRNYRKDSFLFVIAKGGNAIYFDSSVGFYYSVYMGGDGSSYIQNVVLDESKLKQAAGGSFTDVMSQLAITSMMFADPSIRRSVRIGNNKTTGTYSVNIGYSSSSATGFVSGASSVGIGNDASIGTSSDYSVAIGSNSQIGNYKDGVVALGAYSGSNITAAGMMDIGSSNTTYGYNSTNYRLLSGVHDPVGAHDAATKGYVDANAGGPTVVQTTGTSTTDVMSQNGVSTILFRDPASMKQVQVGKNAGASGTNGATAVGHYSYATGDLSTAIGGFAAEAEGAGSVAIGTLSQANTKGEFNIGLPKANSTQQANFGYNGTAYRLLSGVHDGQGLHDAATKGQLDTAIINGGTTAPTTATVGAVGTLYSAVVSNTAHLYACTAIDDTTDPQNPSYTWTTLV